MFNAKTWRDGEALAQAYLKEKGYKILESNAKLAGCEVDIIAFETKKQKLIDLKKKFKTNIINKQAFFTLKKQLSGTYVFVEVKARTSLDFGGPEDAVDMQKQAHIKRFAEAYIKKYNLTNFDFRFDVIAVVLDGESSKIEHFVDAF